MDFMLNEEQIKRIRNRKRVNSFGMINEEGQGMTPTHDNHEIAGMNSEDEINLEQDYPEPELENGTEEKDSLRDALDIYFDSEEFLKKHGEKADEISKKTVKHLDKLISRLEKKERAKEIGPEEE